MTKAFKEYGLPHAIRSDNCPPFGAVAAGGPSRLAVNYVRMGVTPERITPGKPQKNGGHERMHQTLKREAATPPSLTHKAQLVRLERFRQIFNDERPHEALGQIPPARVFAPSPRLWDGRLRSPALGCYARSHRAYQRIDPMAWAGIVRIGSAERRTHRRSSRSRTTNTSSASGRSCSATSRENRS